VYPTDGSTNEKILKIIFIIAALFKRRVFLISSRKFLMKVKMKTFKITVKMVAIMEGIVE